MRTSPWLVLTYTVIIVFGILTALPNVLPKSVLDHVPAWLPHNQVSLGLDLRGGSHLVLEVDEADLTQASGCRRFCRTRGACCAKRTSRPSRSFATTTRSSFP